LRWSGRARIPAPVARRSFLDGHILQNNEVSAQTTNRYIESGIVGQCFPRIWSSQLWPASRSGAHIKSRKLTARS
jgi:hypothetical protein